MKNQIKKLVYEKKFVDSPDGDTIARWKISSWKIFILLIVILSILLVIYAYVATPSPSNFLGNILFYAIVIVGAVAVLWVVGNGAYKARKLIAGFFLAFILILTFYWGLGAVLTHFNILEFYFDGWSLWVMITVLAGLGARRIDGELDRSDVGFGLLVLIICIGANIPIANGAGFLKNLDALIYKILGWSTNFINL